MVQWIVMNRIFGIILVIFVLGVSGTVFLTKSLSDNVQSTPLRTSVSTPTPTISQIMHKIPGEQYVINQERFVSQTFNNCGPASLSMVMSMFGTTIEQGELAAKMRPFNNPAGGVDDKSIFAHEFVSSAKEYGFESLHRPNGTTELIKTFVTNDIPVVVRTWLSPNEDIGHFRIVRGYDDNRQVFIQDDSYEGPNLEYSYATFEKMWQPFNYGYILVYPKEKEAVVRSILGKEFDEKTAYQNSIKRADAELASNSADFYATFNISSAQYHLGNYEDSVTKYEMVENQLPPRMLWYQLEPLLSYVQTGNDEKVLSKTAAILSSGNLAFSELYLVRGDVYKNSGDLVRAREAYEAAIYYNSQMTEARDRLATL